MTDHYVLYESVLVRLSNLNPDALRDLLGMAYKFVPEKLRTVHWRAGADAPVERGTGRAGTMSHLSGERTSQDRNV